MGETGLGQEGGCVVLTENGVCSCRKNPGVSVLSYEELIRVVRKAGSWGGGRSVTLGAVSRDSALLKCHPSPCPTLPTGSLLP